MAYVLTGENVDSGKTHWFNVALRQTEKRDFDTFQNVAVHDLRISMDSETVCVSLTEKSLRALAAELASYVGALDLDSRAAEMGVAE